MKQFILSVGLLLMVLCAGAQTSIDTTLSPDQLIQNVLVGSGVSVSNITATGNDSMYAHFYNTYVMIEGVIITTGSAMNALYPNDNSGISANLTLPGDSLLSMIADTTTTDAAVLEFDLVPSYDTLSITFSFASEDYPDYVCSKFNDPMGIFLSGPKPGTGYYVNENMGVYAGYPVGVGLINPGVEGTNSDKPCLTLSFSNLYYDSPPYTEYDGMSEALTSIAKVIPGQTYHLKIAIADAIDGSFDSAVLLKWQSLISYGTNTTSVADNDVKPTIFPNPANNRFTIQSETETKAIDILSIEGAVLASYPEETQNISTAFLPDGCYFVRISTIHSTNTIPLIISH